MMPKVLWETTMNPRTRRLLRVEISDQIVTDRVINELMGKDPRRGSASSWSGPRKRKNWTFSWTFRPPPRNDHKEAARPKAVARSA